MLLITQHPSPGHLQEWHVNEPLPEIKKGVRVITFQADGHELDLILTAMRGGYNYGRPVISSTPVEALCDNCGYIAESHLTDGTCTVGDHQHQHWSAEL